MTTRHQPRGRDRVGEKFQYSSAKHNFGKQLEEVANNMEPQQRLFLLLFFLSFFFLKHGAGRRVLTSRVGGGGGGKMESDINV